MKTEHPHITVPENTSGHYNTPYGKEDPFPTSRDILTDEEKSASTVKTDPDTRLVLAYDSNTTGSGQQPAIMHVRPSDRPADWEIRNDDKTEVRAVYLLDNARSATGTSAPSPNSKAKHPYCPGKARKPLPKRPSTVPSTDSTTSPTKPPRPNPPPKSPKTTHKYRAKPTSSSRIPRPLPDTARPKRLPSPFRTGNPGRGTST